MSETVNIAAKFAKLTDVWSPRIIAQVNDFHIKAVKLDGEFVWHSHADTDEMFLVVSGTLIIKLRDRSVPLVSGEMFVVPKGVEHKPVATAPCEVLLIERAGTLNTGDTTSELTADERWI